MVRGFPILSISLRLMINVPIVYLLYFIHGKVGHPLEHRHKIETWSFKLDTNLFSWYLLSHPVSRVPWYNEYTIKPEKRGNTSIFISMNGLDERSNIIPSSG
uniref:Uncharacterized protein n=1 Tax=Cacopsylla melanoneura TaxID=428564 RepID=A0A8D9E832_9HEMI